ncbi:MAG: MFS transporter [Cellvibrionaceae bacterium]
MKKNSAMAPFKSTDFTVIWGASVISTIGVRMHEVGAAWYMTTMTDDPFIVALVQAATTLPIFLFALLAGAIADNFSKRKMLLVVNIIMAVLAAILALLACFNIMTPYMLLLFIFLMSSFAAFSVPPKQAINPLLVPKEDLSAAISMNSIGFNISRSIGPAIAGILIVALGPESPFVINALSFIAVIWAFMWWRPTNAKSHEPKHKESISRSIKAGLRYARYSQPLRATLWRAFAFFISASGFWALLPIFVKTEMQAGANVYGLLVAAIGLGAVIGAFLLPKAKKKLSSDQITWIAAAFIIAPMMFTAFPANNTLFTYLFPTWPVDEILAVMGSITFGIAWMWTLSTFSVSAQGALPDWVRARGLAIYLMVFFGSMSVGSIIWGAIATNMGIKTALIISSVTLTLGMILSRKQKLNLGEAVDLAPSENWAEPNILVKTEQDKGLLNERSPVMIMIEYNLAPENIDKFLSMMCQLQEARKQYGAYGWEVLQQSDKSDVFVECFFDVSWIDYLTHSERQAGKDQVLEQQIHALLKEGEKPVIKHFLGPQGLGSHTNC